MHAHFDVGYENETAVPILDDLRRKNLPNTARERQSSRRTQSHEHQSVMRSRRELPDVGKIQILRDEKPLCALSRLPDVRISLSSEILLPNIVRIVTE